MKTDNTSLEEQLHKMLDFFTEPGTGEKYLKDLENDLLALIQHSIDTETNKARIEENELLARHFANKPFYATATIYAQNRIKQLEEKEL